MDVYKRIERQIGEYIGARYRNAAEVGAGRNFDAARIIAGAGSRVFCTDIRTPPEDPGVPFRTDDIFAPDRTLYQGIDLIYSIRPAVEMVPPLIDLAKNCGCDLLVYHLGFETYGDGGETIDCGVILHRYVRAPRLTVSQNPSKSVD
ncbi:MAG: UPF0146 family protein [Methanoregulaceae archaeon]